MKSAYSVLLLASQLGAATCLFLKMYTFVASSLSWGDAQTYCRNNYVDLVSFESTVDMQNFSIIMKRYLQGMSWIGLSKTPGAHVFTHWSDRSPLEDTYWETPKASNGDCVVVLPSDKWKTVNCTELLPFFCYSWYPQVILVNELKTWDEALTYCRTNYDDLISVASEADFFALNSSLKNQMTVVWTGLRFIDGLWFWVNGETLESLVNLPSCPAPSFRCGALEPGTDVLENRNCLEQMNFICY